ncbi:TetR/AcrR family transcriptional regulator [Streptomyces sp. NPDC057638]|uniref:TetR/AcrR family transcriptional regulator n=1 Tax=Streptomyces sp. NPDC057638 TaxID=3346190 RepID=UPI003674AEF6
MRAEVPKRTTARRPPDRKARIVAAAAELFCERGYHNVSVADVAAAVDITAPALYRHFRGKPDLLLQVVTSSIDAIAEAVATAPDLDTYLRTAVSRAIDRRGTAVLWQREARHLPEDHRDQLRRTLIGVRDGIGALILAERPELTTADAQLLAWSALSVLGSVSGHRATLPRRRFEPLLYGLVHAATRLPLARTTAAAADPSPATGYTGLDLSRREEILHAAIRLFDERGFQSVSTDDIGEASGASGPSIYKHFPSKTDLLVAAVVRAGEQRRAATTLALAEATGPRESLDALLRSYIAFALRHSHLIGLLIAEIDQLPEKERKASRQAQRDYLALWTRVLGEVRPGLERAEARIVLGATLTTVDNAVRTGGPGERADLAGRLQAIATTLLLTPAPAAL